MITKKTIRTILTTTVIVALAQLPLMPTAVAEPSSAAGVSFQAQPINCVNGFKKGAYKKKPNGMVTKMVCKTPVITCPENTAPGVTVLTEPKVKNLGGGDKSLRFKFVYTCKYFKPQA